MRAVRLRDICGKLRAGPHRASEAAVRRQPAAAAGVVQRENASGERAAHQHREPADPESDAALRGSPKLPLLVFDGQAWAPFPLLILRLPEGVAGGAHRTRHLRAQPRGHGRAQNGVGPHGRGLARGRGAVGERHDRFLGPQHRGGLLRPGALGLR